MADTSTALALQSAGERGPTETPEQSLRRLLERIQGYDPHADTYLIRRAYHFAASVHRNYWRDSGDPYITHPLAAAHILADLEMDSTAIAACLLHDTIEDCAAREQRGLEALREKLKQAKKARRQEEIRTLQESIDQQERAIEAKKEGVARELAEQFGPTIFELVEGVTRLSEIRFREQYTNETQTPPTAQQERLHRRIQAENLRKMFLATAKDLRVLIIKLADRLHNLRTLWAKQEEEKRRRIARETELIYARLAHRLGISHLKAEMEDLALQYLEPKKYEEISQRVAKTWEERNAEIERVIAEVKRALEREGIRAEVTGRPKNIYSIYHKMLRQDLDFEDIYDLTAIRILVNTVPECYEALGVVHSLWTHQPEHFADYISQPKPNRYQSLHTKVLVPGPEGTREVLEVQIRTWQMHQVCEYGVAAHWRYKEEDRIDDEFANRLSALRQLLDSAGDEDALADDYLAQVQQDLWEEEVFVFTPRGDLIDLPVGATPVDFAYRIHTEVGHTCIGAKVNRRIVPLDYQLQNGDIVEIIRQKHSGPSRDWLQFVKTGQARARIRSYLKKQQREENVQAGREMLEHEAQRARMDLAALQREYWEYWHPRLKAQVQEERADDLLTQIARQFSLNHSDDLLAAIGYGGISAASVLNRVRQEIAEVRRLLTQAAPPEAPPTTAPPLQPRRLKVAVTASGDIRNVLFNRSKCCFPLPGQPIMGYVTRGRGITIHRANCPNLAYLQRKDPDRILSLEWETDTNLLYDVPLFIRAVDRIGLLKDVSAVISNHNINILSAHVEPPRRDITATIQVVLEVLNQQQLESVMRNLRKLPGVVTVRQMGVPLEGRPA
ncbi:MAG TPA: RelA/SpoT family protein [Armatimonadetes bacterium]|nr:RelA/SpoT family protein [Armatimonadota bacterium]